MLAFSRPARSVPVIPVAIGLAVAGVVAVIAVLAVGGQGRGGDTQPGVAASLPTATLTPAGQTPLPAPTKAQAIAPPREVTPGPAPASTPTPRLEPTLTPTPNTGPDAHSDSYADSYHRNYRCYSDAIID